MDPATIAAGAEMAKALGPALMAPPMPPDNFSPVSSINVAPVGVNLGEILKGYDQGGVTNGGMGANIPSRYTQQYLEGNKNFPAESQDDGTMNMLFWGGGALAALGVTYFILKKRGK